MEETFDSYFLNIVPFLCIDDNRGFLTNADLIKELLHKIIHKFKYDPNIQAINKSKSLSFSFSHESYNFVSSLIQNMDSSKAYPKENGPTNIIKKYISTFANISHEYINRCITNSQFIKVLEVVPILKNNPKKHSKL